MMMGNGMWYQQTLNHPHKHANNYNY
jgi:hypothetical protein